MKIVAISDTHGKFPESLPDGDVLCVAGDICPVDNHVMDYQAKWITNNWIPWCRARVTKDKFKAVVFIAGNHDLWFESMADDWKGAEEQFIARLPVGVHYLRDTGVEIEGKKFYGTPWQPEFCDWAFNAKSEKLAQMFSKIPKGVDVVIAHGPPKGYGDTVVGRELGHLGSWELQGALIGAEPKYCVFGHIHSGDHTPVKLEGCRTMLANVSLLNENYKLCEYKPLVFEV